MSKEEKNLKELQFAKKMIITYLSSYDLTFDGLNDLYEITTGNKMVLMQHLKGLSKIFQIAIQQLEKSDK